MDCIIILPSDKVIYGDVEEIGKNQHHVQAGRLSAIFQIADGLQAVSHSIPNLQKSEATG
ncbi:MAG: hypothetical protein FWG71_07900 [Synergistaceae bacterium]|nr:hypothetical protein [Synergistaceae bacterium]